MRSGVILLVKPSARRHLSDWVRPHHESRPCAGFLVCGGNSRATSGSASFCLGCNGCPSNVTSVTLGDAAYPVLVRVTEVTIKRLFQEAFP